MQRRKFLGGCFFAKPHHETPKAPTFYRKVPLQIEVLLMDKRFDAEWLHQWLKSNGTFSIAPVRKDCRRGKHRKLMRDCMDWHLYWQRNIVESMFSAL